MQLGPPRGRVSASVFFLMASKMAIEPPQEPQAKVCSCIVCVCVRARVGACLDVNGFLLLSNSSISCIRGGSLVLL